MARRHRRRPSGTGSRIVTHDDHDDELDGVPWSAATYPNPDPRLAPAPANREYVETAEALFWKIDGSHAFSVGVPHPLDQEKLLCTLDQLRKARTPKSKGTITR